MNDTAATTAKTPAKTLEHTGAVKNGLLRLFFAGVAILLEISLILVIIFRLSEYAEWIAIGSRFAAGILVLWIFNRDRTSSLKISWIILIMVVPLVGVLLFLLIGLNGATIRMRRRYAEMDRLLRPFYPDNEAVQEHLDRQDRRIGNIARYIRDRGGYPAYEDTEVTYFADTREALEAQKEALRAAERFIFMEYYAIEDRESWRSIQEILEERSASGVEVRVFYDDIGSIGFVSTDFVKRLQSRGIRAKVFNPVSPYLNVFLNNRGERRRSSG